MATFAVSLEERQSVFCNWDYGGRPSLGRPRREREGPPLRYPPGELTATTSQTLSVSQSQSAGSKTLGTSSSGGTTSVSSTSSTQGQNVPEFPYQSAVVGVFVIILTVGFIVARRRGKA